MAASRAPILSQLAKTMRLAPDSANEKAVSFLMPLTAYNSIRELLNFLKEKLTLIIKVTLSVLLEATLKVGVRVGMKL